MITEKKIRRIKFFYKYNTIRVSADELSQASFFVAFVRKLVQTLILTLFSKNLVALQANKKVIQFSTIKLSTLTNAMHLLSNVASEKCPNLGNLDDKTTQNWLKIPTLPSSPHSFFRNQCFYRKTKVIRFLIIITSPTTNFMFSLLKMISKVCQKEGLQI